MKKDKMFAGFLLNIFAIIIPVVLGLALVVLPSSNDLDDGGGVTVSLEADLSYNLIVLAMVVGIVIFAMGIVLYFSKNLKMKKTLSIIYLIAAVVDLCGFFIVTLTYILATCGLGAVLYVPGILQILAGTKFVSAIRNYEEERF